MTTIEVLKTIEEIFATNLKLRRQSCGFATQAQLAEALGVTEFTVRNWEQSKNLPELASLTALVQALKTTPSQLFADPKDVVSKPALKQAFSLITEMVEDLEKLGPTHRKIVKHLAALDEVEAIGLLSMLERKSSRTVAESNSPKKLDKSDSSKSG